MIYFTADHHFGHNNVIKYCNRPFHNIEEMDRVLMDNWNSIITDEDLVYHLGDFALMSQIKIAEYLDKLKGYKVLIKGNHDRLNAANKNRFLNIYKELIMKFGDITITMSHYPETFKSAKEIINLHGHSHGKFPLSFHKIDVGVDNNNYTPISLSQIMEKI